MSDSNSNYACVLAFINGPMGSSRRTLKDVVHKMNNFSLTTDEYLQLLVNIYDNKFSSGLFNHICTEIDDVFAVVMYLCKDKHMSKIYQVLKYRDAVTCKMIHYAYERYGEETAQLLFDIRTGGCDPTDEEHCIYWGDCRCNTLNQLW